MATSPTQRTIRELYASSTSFRDDLRPPLERFICSFVRFASKIESDPETGCWNWTGARDRHGYGRFGIRGKTVFAHRFMYQISVGDIPDDMVIDHLCRNPSCCNTDHLEIVTQGENVRRGVRWLA